MSLAVDDAGSPLSGSSIVESMTDDDLAPDVPSPAQRLERARADLVRRGDLGDRVSAARAALAAAREERTALASRVEGEAGDVERLERASASALWSRFRGRHDEGLLLPHVGVDEVVGLLDEPVDVGTPCSHTGVRCAEGRPGLLQLPPLAAEVLVMAATES